MMGSSAGRSESSRGPDRGKGELQAILDLISTTASQQSTPLIFVFGLDQSVFPVSVWQMTP